MIAARQVALRSMILPGTPFDTQRFATFTFYVISALGSMGLCTPLLGNPPPPPSSTSTIPWSLPTHPHLRPYTNFYYKRASCPRPRMALFCWFPRPSPHVIFLLGTSSPLGHVMPIRLQPRFGGSSKTGSFIVWWRVPLG